MKNKKNCFLDRHFYGAKKVFQNCVWTMKHKEILKRPVPLMQRYTSSKIRKLHDSREDRYVNENQTENPQIVW